MSIQNIENVRILDEDTCQFELKSTGDVRRYFKAATPNACEEWVSALKSAIKSFGKGSNNLGQKRQRPTLSNIRNFFGDFDNEVVLNTIKLETN